jgi:hypothetical protein
MIIKKMGQGLGGCNGAEHERKEQPERADGAIRLESFGAPLVKLRTDESVSFQSSNPCSGV